MSGEKQYLTVDVIFDSLKRENEELRSEYTRLTRENRILRALPDLPSQEMCRAAVEYMNGADIYSRLPLKVLEIEESIYAEVWKAMRARSVG